MLLSSLIGKRVLDLASGKMLGLVSGVLVDGAKLKVAALLLEPRQWYRAPEALPLNQLAGVGDVLIARQRQLLPLPASPLEALAEENLSLMGLPLFTASGQRADTVSDAQIDSNGALLELLSDRQRYPIQALAVLGPDAAILADGAPWQPDPEAAAAGPDHAVLTPPSPAAGDAPAIPAARGEVTPDAAPQPSHSEPRVELSSGHGGKVVVTTGRVSTNGVPLPPIRAKGERPAT